MSEIFDCYDLTAVGLSMDDNMRAELCGAVLHSDRGNQYTSASYRTALNEYGVKQSMNSAADITRIRRANRRPQWNKYPLQCCSKFLNKMCKAILVTSKNLV